MRRGEKIRVQLPAVASIRVLRVPASLFIVIVTGKRKEKPIFIGSGQVFLLRPCFGLLFASLIFLIIPFSKSNNFMLLEKK
jgi:hypothetical protein